MDTFVTGSVALLLGAPPHQKLHAPNRSVNQGFYSDRTTAIRQSAPRKKQRRLPRWDRFYTLNIRWLDFLAFETFSERTDCSSGSWPERMNYSARNCARDSVAAGLPGTRFPRHLVGRWKAAQEWLLETMALRAPVCAASIRATCRKFYSIINRRRAFSS